jgi:hypothetical protein
VGPNNIRDQISLIITYHHALTKKNCIRNIYLLGVMIGDILAGFKLRLTQIHAYHSLCPWLLPLKCATQVSFLVRKQESQTLMSTVPSSTFSVLLGLIRSSVLDLIRRSLRFHGHLGVLLLILGSENSIRLHGSCFSEQSFDIVRPNPRT